MCATTAPGASRTAVRSRPHAACASARWGSSSSARRAEFDVEDWDAFEARWKAAILALKPERRTAADHISVAAGYRQNAEWESAAREYEAALKLAPKTRGVTQAVILLLSLVILAAALNL